ncbi:FecR family protein [Humidesulfovibrio mexicanus]|uniref:FecR family protein n=1 Tax=Humidesulfovibrio mexicanus TaxID=147047 RepID=A0A238Z394_9BACT|nr:FecR family protein [Humidesulfovibrio mexicanus]SNR77333.1 FecR family protein [Humidesulfovibrio mexicanus]
MPDSPSRRAPFRAGLAAALAGLLLCAAFSLGAYAADVESIGHVSRAQGLSFAVRGANLRALERNSLVGRDDVLKTGPGSRLEIVLLDETRLALGADTVFGVERYGLGRRGGGVLFKLDKGSFRLVTGGMEATREVAFEVATPLGVVGVLGADFWAGLLLEGELDVLLVSGKGVSVVTDGGRTEITRPMEGLSLSSRAAPPPAPSMWSPDRRERALRTVAFGK